MKSSGFGDALMSGLSRATTVIKKTQVAPAKLNSAMPNIGASSEDFFIRMAYDLIANSKEYRKNETLRNAIVASVSALDNGSTDAAIIFTPFQIACRSGNSELLVIAIDCLGKLFSYNYWKAAPNHVKGNEDDDNDGTNSMIVFVVDTLCDGFSGETTDEKVQLQLIKALQAAVTNADPAFSLHGATLLKAIRTCYNIFLLSTSMHVQHAAQATVIHMVQNVMSRIPVSQKGEPLNVSQNSVPESNEEQSNNTKSMDSIKEYDREIKDAYKVLRTLCLLSQKPVPATEGVLDLRSQLIRSKLLALHLLTTTLKANIKVFLVKSKVLATLADDKENHDMLFIDALKNMLFVSLTRNATSTVPPIFEVALELFGVLMHLRAFLKKEIGVFFTEIVIPILEDKKNITWYQRYFLLKTIGNILSDPANEGGKLLVEIFINYDCDVQSSAKENIWERLCLALSRILSQHDTNQLPSSSLFIPINSYVTGDSKDAPPLTTVNLVALSRDQVKELYSTNGDPVELKRECLRFLVGGILHPLGIWCDFMSNQSKTKILPNTEDTEKEAPATLTIDADPETIGSQKQRKQAISEGVKRFNFKPKKGFQYLIDTKCIASMDPKEIARFLLFTEGIKKSAIGEFLGEGEPENIAIMHAFVDEMDFTGLKFVEALRQFLQNFRLPGEAQKIDRFMLKFAARYLQGNPATFKSADTAYVLAYSVIMLNTDQHNPQVKKRMSKEDFVKNNRGIDEGKDLAENVLVEIFDEIALNEINMKDEQPIKNQTPEIVHNLLSVIAPDTDLFKTKKEPSSEISKASEQMAEHTEATIKELHLNYSKASGGTPPKYITAKRSEHVKQMFEIIWMSLLAGISTPLQESDDIDLNQLSLDAFQESLHLAFMFGMELEAKAFFSTLQKFNFLNNPMHAKFKNILALKTCIEIGARDGNNLGEIWNDLVICISQYDKFFQAQEEPTTSGQIKRDTSGKIFKGIDETLFNGQIQHITAAIDKIFSNSVKLSGDAIVQLVKALCKTSWTEITTSVDHNQPRMYCLQRLVEISYFNMTRIRVEWANTWAILGEHFNHVGAYPNTNVGFFAIDKLRQLSIKFLELEELPNFKFQKDFLKSFEEIVANTPDAKIKDMCLACLQQIVQVKGKGLKSGWKTVLGCLIRATKEVESIVNLAFDIFKYIVKEHLGDVLQNGSFPELLAGNVEFCKCDRAPKAPPQGMEIFSKIMANASMFAAHIKNEHRTDTFNEQQEMNLRFWTPLLFGLHDVITSAETGFGIRSRAITSLFETIKKQGQDFDLKSWELLTKFVIFPIFDDLKQTDAAINSKAGGKESNTVIQSLDQLIEIFQVYQEKISFMLSDMLDLLKVCLMHKNEILSQVGSTCIQKLINKCHQGFNQHDWDLVANLFVFVFQETTPYFLVFKYEGAEAGFIDSANKIMKQDICLPPERKQFQAQLYKCGLNAMAVKTLQDMLFNDPEILNSIPFCTTQTLLDCFEHSFQFSGLFNSSIGLRTALNKMGYMSQIPNLLKIETSSAQSLLDMLIKMQEKGLLQDRFFGLCHDILSRFNNSNEGTKISNQRIESAWKPVVCKILEAFVNLNDDQLAAITPLFYKNLIDLLLQDVNQDICFVLHTILIRVGRMHNICK